MSTRAAIIIRYKNIHGSTQDTHVYHHCDGNPKGVGADLKEFCEVQFKHAGFHEDDLITTLIKEGIKDDNTYEWTSCIHGDEEYIYIVDCIGKNVKAYKRSFSVTISNATAEDIIAKCQEVSIPDGKPTTKVPISKAQ